MTPAELIQGWREGRIIEGTAVQVRGGFMATASECWMPTQVEWSGWPERRTSVQLIGKTDDLLDGLHFFRFCGKYPGGLVMECEDVVVEGTVSRPTVSGYAAAVKDVTSLVVYDDMEGEGLPSGLGNGLPPGTLWLRNGKFLLEWDPREE